MRHYSGPNVVDSLDCTSQYISAHVVVSNLFDVTNMQTQKTRAHFTRVSFGEILWKFV